MFFRRSLHETVYWVLPRFALLLRIQLLRCRFGEVQPICTALVRCKLAAGMSEQFGGLTNSGDAGDSSPRGF